MDLPENFICNFGFKKRFVDEGDWSKLAKCIHRILENLYAAGVLTVKPAKVTSEYMDVDNEHTTLETKIYFGDEEYWKEYWSKHKVTD